MTLLMSAQSQAVFAVTDWFNLLIIVFFQDRVKNIVSLVRYILLGRFPQEAVAVRVRGRICCRSDFDEGQRWTAQSEAADTGYSSWEP